MNIGIVGAGNIGKTLARKLQRHGHQVRLANSRGPESLRDFAQQTGVTAVTVREAVQRAELIILTIPLGKTPDVQADFRDIPKEVIIVETMNYYPERDGEIAAIEQGLTNSAWVEQVLGHPVIKAFNNIGAYSFFSDGQPAGTPGRIALSVSGDDEAAKQTVIELVNQTGFEGYDAGPITDSWRQQPGNPTYCTDLPLEEAIAARARSVRTDAPANRDIISQKLADLGEEYMQIVVSGNYPTGFVDRGIDVLRHYYGYPSRQKPA
ncbi:NADPH-dependent F420 reductase [Spirosoma pomorum]